MCDQDLESQSRADRPPMKKAEASWGHTPAETGSRCDVGHGDEPCAQHGAPLASPLHSAIHPAELRKGRTDASPHLGLYAPCSAIKGRCYWQHRSQTG